MVNSFNVIKHAPWHVCKQRPGYAGRRRERRAPRSAAAEEAAGRSSLPPALRGRRPRGWPAPRTRRSTGTSSLAARRKKRIRYNIDDDSKG